MLEIDHANGTWVASCGGVEASAASAGVAISAALDEDARPLGSSRSALVAWIDEQASTLEREASARA
jgi:hypothetical protein